MNLGERPVFRCKSDKKVKWFQHKVQSVQANAYPSGSYDSTLTIRGINRHNIGRYCCYGYDQVSNTHFFDCVTMALLG